MFIYTKYITKYIENKDWLYLNNTLVIRLITKKKYRYVFKYLVTNKINYGFYTNNKPLTTDIDDLIKCQCIQ
jgi:hypothetical protein